MSSRRPGTCAEPGPYDAHCTDYRMHRYSCYDAGADVSWNDRSPEDWQTYTPHDCGDATCPDSPMRILTVQQPWAWAIIHGGKTVENRTQAWSYRGPLAIHAGARLSQRGFASPLIEQAHNDVNNRTRRAMDRGEMVELNTDYLTGAVIGVVDLVDVHPAAGCCEPWGEAAYDEVLTSVAGRRGDQGPSVTKTRRRIDVVHLVLENPRPIEPIPAKGFLGLWHNVELLAEVRKRLR